MPESHTGKRPTHLTSYGSAITCLPLGQRAIVDATSSSFSMHA